MSIVGPAWRARSGGAARFAGLIAGIALFLALAGCGGGSGDPAVVVPPAMAPTITAQPANQSVTAGSPASFSVTASGTAPLAYQWQSSSDGTTFASIAGATAAQYTVGSASTSQNETSYRVVVTNVAGSVTSAAARLTVAPAPVAPSFVQQPSDQTSEIGGTVTFSVAVGGEPLPTLQWQRSVDGGVSWTDIAGATAATVAIPNLGIGDDSTRIRVLATNAAGTAVSQVAQIKVTAQGAPVFVVQPQGQFIAAGEIPVFSVQVSGNPPPTLRWQRGFLGGSNWEDVSFNGVPATEPTFDPRRTPLDGESFRVVATNSVGTTISEPAAVYLRRTGGCADGWCNVASRPSAPRNFWRAVAAAGGQAVVAVDRNGLIVRSSDGGMNWATVRDRGPHPSTGQWFRATGIGFGPTGNGVVLGDGSAYFYTRDGGRSWSAAELPSTFGYDSRSAVAFVGPDTAIVVIGQWIFRSTDGGRTFAAVSIDCCFSNLVGVAFANADRGVAVGKYGAILRTNDGGRSWTALQEQVGSELRGVAFASESVGYILGESGVLRSSDGGQTWAPLPDGPIEAVSAGAFGGTNRGVIVGAAGRIHYTDDGGSTWRTARQSTADDLVSVAFVDSNTVIALAAGGELLRSTDSEQNWTRDRLADDPEVFRLNGVAFAGADIAVAVGNSGRILRTSDAGRNWLPVPSTTTGDLHAVAFASSSTGVATGAGGIILRTSDGGLTWTSVASPSQRWLYGVTFAVPNIAIAVGDGGTILRSADGGLSWSMTPSGAGSALRSVAFQDASTGVAVGSGDTSSRNVLRTSDGGRTWAAATPETDLPLRGVALSPAGFGIAVGRSVFCFEPSIGKSVDGGRTWLWSDEGIVILCAPAPHHFGVAFRDPLSVVVVGENGMVAVVSVGPMSYQMQWRLTNEELYGVAFANPARGAIVGANGTILITDD